MLAKRNRSIYSILTVTTMILGLSTRYFRVYLPKWTNLYLGDALWALMIFFLFAMLFKNRKATFIMVLAILFSFGIEISQLYHSPWIDTLRTTRLGGLVLGYGFLWSDLVSYCAGISIGMLVDRQLNPNI